MDLNKFCRDTNLGNVINISKLSGGLMHKMFKVETDKETYAIKVLNPEVMSRSDAYSNFIISETISNLVKDNGIIVSSALLIDGNYLTKYDNMYYMVFEFVNGRTLTDEEITVEHCRKIGKILSQIHSLDYQSLKLENKRVNYKRLYDWESYINNPNFVDMSYKEKYLKNYEKYNSLLKRANEKTDMLTIESDYQDLMDMFIDNYEELGNIPYLSERLKVYEIIDMLNDYRKHREKFRLEEAKNKVRELLEMKG